MLAQRQLWLWSASDFIFLDTVGLYEGGGQFCPFPSNIPTVSVLVRAELNYGTVQADILNQTSVL